MSNFIESTYYLNSAAENFYPTRFLLPDDRRIHLSGFFYKTEYRVFPVKIFFVKNQDLHQKTKMMVKIFRQADFSWHFVKFMVTPRSEFQKPHEKAAWPTIFLIKILIFGKNRTTTKKKYCNSAKKSQFMLPWQNKFTAPSICIMHKILFRSHETRHP